MAPGTPSSRASTVTRLPAPVAPSRAGHFEPLVGFKRERAHLDKMLRDARTGHSAVTGIHGLPGSGKTFLLESMVAQATGFAVVRLPAEAGVDPSADLWVKAFELASDTVVEGPSCRAGSDPVHQCIITALRATSRHDGTPALLVFDDCRAEQKAAAEAVAAAVMDPDLGVPAIMVVAWADGPHGDTLSFTRPAFPAHQLHPLTLEQSADYLTDRIGRLPETTVLAELWRGSGGNPAALLSACSHLSDEELNGLIPIPDPLPIGPELVAPFSERVSELEGDDRAAATIAAAAHMPRPVLEAALALADLDMTALEPATDLGVLAILGDRIEFPHPLCRSAVFESAPARCRIAARRAVSQAFVRAGMAEQAALQAALGSSGRDDVVANLCADASWSASQRQAPEVAARFEVLGARSAQDQQQAARHLITASSLWQAAGDPERAIECLRRITPVNSSPAIVGQATYQAARIAFAEASPQASAQMAAGAEACASDEPEIAIAMLADAAASAIVADQIVQGVRAANRAAELAEDRPGFLRDLGRTALDTILPLAVDEGPATEGHEHVVSVMNTQRLFAGSPQLAYVLGSSLVQAAPPALLGRWFSWMHTSADMDSSGTLTAVLSLVRSKERLSAGAALEAMAAAESAVAQFEAVDNRPLLARALGWCAWTRACAGEVGKVFESATRFFSLETPLTHSARLQALMALAHAELQKGHLERSSVWLRAVEHDAATREGYRGCTDWPVVPFFLQLCLLAGHDAKKTRDSLAAGTLASSGRWTRHLSAWNDALRETDPHAGLLHLDKTLVAGPARTPMLNAQIKLTSGLLQRVLGALDLATFNVSEAQAEFERCEASGWAALATGQLEAYRSPTDAVVRPPAGERIELAGGGDPDSLVSTPGTAASVPTGIPVRRPTYEVRLLGQFTVSRDGAPTTIPPGHAAQAIKVVALFRQVSVDELAELLWPGAEPGVGTRRLRNILWRVKSSCGDILRRSDNFICLETDVITDVERFEDEAGRAFKQGLADQEAHDLARRAIRLYGGELLPSDRYTDWTTGPREALTQIRLQLLDLMLTYASRSGNRQEAFALLEDLIDADPYEERYYLQLATLHDEAGNRSRMRASISRGERMLADLGVEPSVTFLEAARKLQS